jgi:hypothetical protein
MESIESAVEDDWEEMAVAVENWIENTGVGSWQMMEESKQFS